MELKLNTAYKKEGIQSSFNRTFMELKRVDIFSFFDITCMF